MMRPSVSPFDIEAAEASLYEWDDQEAAEHNCTDEAKGDPHGEMSTHA
jgi:hypothetical protein